MIYTSTQWSIGSFGKTCGNLAVSYTVSPRPRHGPRNTVLNEHSHIPSSQIIIDRPQQEVPEFFPGARLNYAENILKYNDDAIGITAARETGSLHHYTRRQLRALVRDMSNAMRAHGVKPHDRIAGMSSWLIPDLHVMLRPTLVIN